MPGYLAIVHIPAFTAGVAIWLCLSGCQPSRAVVPSLDGAAFDGTPPGDVSSPADASLIDDTSLIFVDLPAAPDQGQGPPGKCPKVCPPPSGGKVCISGKVYLGPELIAKPGKVKWPKRVTPASGVTLRLHDPINLFTPPSKVLASGTIYNDDGCFIFTDLTVPFSGAFAVVVNDGTPTVDKWAATAVMIPSSSANITSAEIPAFPSQLVKSWGLKSSSVGAVLLWFRDVAGTPVASVTTSTTGSVPLYFGEEIDKPPYFVKGAVQTSASGLAAVAKAPVGMYTFKKPGCSISQKFLGSVAGLVVLYTVSFTGC